MKRLLLVTLALSLPLTHAVRAENDDNGRRKRVRHHSEEAAVGNSAPVAPAAMPARPQVRLPAQPIRSEANLNQNSVQSRTVVSSSRTARPVHHDSFVAARERVIVVRHPRAWWVARYPHTRFILFGGGYYYWSGGYWYPAPGYDPYYSSYLYNEPIYAPNSVAPGTMIENVQAALRTQGYYHGSVDGLVGPETRAALGTYQRDHGLLVTQAIDEATLSTLGLG